MGELRAIYRGKTKYIYGPRTELYDLALDPRERDNLLLAEPEREQPFRLALQQLLKDRSRQEASDAVFDASDETREKLAALGYIETAAERPEAVREELLSDGLDPHDHVRTINQAQQLRRMVAAQQFTQARAVAEELLEGAPQHSYYRAQLAAALLGLGALDQAAEIVERTEVLSSVNAASFLEVAAALFEGGEPNRALAMTQRINEASNSAAAHLLLAEMLQERGDPEGFADHTQRALERDPTHRETHLAVARYRLEGGDLEDARKHLDVVLLRYPTDSAARVLLAQLARESGQHEAALGHAERVLRLDPESCEAHREKLESLRKLQRQADLGRAVKELPTQCEREGTS